MQEACIEHNASTIGMKADQILRVESLTDHCDMSVLRPQKWTALTWAVIRAKKNLK